MLCKNALKLLTLSDNGLIQTTYSPPSLLDHIFLRDYKHPRNWSSQVDKITFYHNSLIFFFLATLIRGFLQETNAPYVGVHCTNLSARFIRLYVHS